MAVILQRLLNNGFSGKHLCKVFNLFLHFPASFSLVVTRIADAISSCSACDKRSAATYLGLAVSSAITKDLAWSRNRINADIAVNSFLGQRHVNIARTNDLVHLRNRSCTKSQCCNRLCTAHFVNLIAPASLAATKYPDSPCRLLPGASP